MCKSLRIVDFNKSRLLRLRHCKQKQTEQRLNTLPRLAPVLLWCLHQKNLVSCDIFSLCPFCQVSKMTVKVLSVSSEDLRFSADTVFQLPGLQNDQPDQSAISLNRHVITNHSTNILTDLSTGGTEFPFWQNYQHFFFWPRELADAGRAISPSLKFMEKVILPFVHTE